MSIYGGSMSKQNPLKKLSRYDLLGLIYDIRKENADLEARCEAAEQRVADLEQRADGAAVLAKLDEMEKLLLEMQAELKGRSARRSEE